MARLQGQYTFMPTILPLAGAPVEQMGKLVTERNASYDNAINAENAFSVAQSSFDVAPGTERFRNQMADDYQKKISTLLDKHDGAWESAAFARDVNLLRKESLKDPNWNTLSKNLEEYNRYKASVDKGELDFQPWDAFTRRINETGNLELFNKDTEKQLDYQARAKDMVMQVVNAVIGGDNTNVVVRTTDDNGRPVPAFLQTSSGRNFHYTRGGKGLSATIEHHIDNELLPAFLNTAEGKQMWRTLTSPYHKGLSDDKAMDEMKKFLESQVPHRTDSQISTSWVPTTTEGSGKKGKSGETPEVNNPFVLYEPGYMTQEEVTSESTYEDLRQNTKIPTNDEGEYKVTDVTLPTMNWSTGQMDYSKSNITMSAPANPWKNPNSYNQLRVGVVTPLLNDPNLSGSERQNYLNTFTSGINTSLESRNLLALDREVDFQIASNLGILKMPSGLNPFFDENLPELVASLPAGHKYAMTPQEINNYQKEVARQAISDLRGDAYGGLQESVSSLGKTAKLTGLGIMDIFTGANESETYYNQEVAQYSLDQARAERLEAFVNGDAPLNPDDLPKDAYSKVPNHKINAIKKVRDQIAQENTKKSIEVFPELSFETTGDAKMKNPIHQVIDSNISDWITKMDLYRAPSKNNLVSSLVNEKSVQALINNGYKPRIISMSLSGTYGKVDNSEYGGNSQADKNNNITADTSLRDREGKHFRIVFEDENGKRAESAPGEYIATGPNVVANLQKALTGMTDDNGNPLTVESFEKDAKLSALYNSPAANSRAGYIMTPDNIDLVLKGTIVPFTDPKTGESINSRINYKTIVDAGFKAAKAVSDNNIVNKDTKKSLNIGMVFPEFDGSFNGDNFLHLGVRKIGDGVTGDNYVVVGADGSVQSNPMSSSEISGYLEIHYLKLYNYYVDIIKSANQ